MESLGDEVSEAGETEDLPSDFFDDFNKDEFMEGLSVIDECWDESHAGVQKSDSLMRINAEELDSVSDLRELIGGENNAEKPKVPQKKKYIKPPMNTRYKWHKHGSPQTSNSDDFIKPGSRRDPSKTSEAIKKDKEVKVQQFLAKTLDSSDDLRPPGTELDDYYEDEKKKDNVKLPTFSERNLSSHDHLKVSKELSLSPQRTRIRNSPRLRRSPRARYSPRMRVSPRGNPRHFVRQQSPVQFRRMRRNYSPQRRSPQRRSPVRRSPIRHSPVHRSPMRHSPVRHSPIRRSPYRRSPRRYSPMRRSPRRQFRSRSPRRHLSPRRSQSRSHSPRHSDNFLYPNNPDVPSQSYPPLNLYGSDLSQQYASHMHSEFPGSGPGYSYSQGPAYDNVVDSYNYTGTPVAPAGISTVVPLPNINPVPTPRMINPVVAAPSMVPAPAQPLVDKATPYDALAQLVAEGKISQEDYLKLTPNKGAAASTMDTKTRVMVLTRCNQALNKLSKLLLPNRLVLNNELISSDTKCLVPKYCSPLKRQAVTEFSFTKGLVTPAQQTKQLVESIISTLGLDKVVSKYKKKLPKDMKDAVIQTTKLQCELCEIRESTKYHDVGTSTEPEYFTSTVHTQVVEQDLVSSKSIFNPSGSVGEGSAMSIAHLTPAQLVSQLAARAKTLKQPEPPTNQFMRRPQNYEYNPRGGQYHPSYNNYRY